MYPQEHRNLPLKTAERYELRRRSFDVAARAYDRFRPGYPEQSFDDLVRLSGIPEGGRILEIGPGTGQATLPLARRGFSILGIEIGASMARLCRRNLSGFSNVEILNVPFEEWKPEPEGFDLVFSATAFHWIRPKVAFARSARALKPGGTLALVWNFLDTPDNDFYRDLRVLYRRIAPQIHLSRPPEQRIERQRKKIIGSGLFGPVTILRYPWNKEYTADSYIGLLKTMSDHAILGNAARRDVFPAIRRLISEHGGSFVRPVVAVLFLAPKRRQA